MVMVVMTSTGSPLRSVGLYFQVFTVSSTPVRRSGLLMLIIFTSLMVPSSVISACNMTFPSTCAILANDGYAGFGWNNTFPACTPPLMRTGSFDRAGGVVGGGRTITTGAGCGSGGDAAGTYEVCSPGTPQ